MSALSARLVDGRFILDDPTDEDGPTITLVLEEDQGDELDPEEQARLEAFLDRSIAAVDRGETVSAEQMIARLRAQRPSAPDSDDDEDRAHDADAPDKPALTARLQDGRFVLDQPDSDGDLPRRLVIEDPGDDLDDEERAALSALIEASYAASARGDERPARALLAEFQARGSN